MTRLAKLVVVLVSAVAVLVVGSQGSVAPAHASLDEVYAASIIGADQVPTSVTVLGNGDVLRPAGVVFTTSGCLPLDSDGTQLCGGAQASDDEVTVRSPTLDDFVHHGGEAYGALEWIADEAVDALRSLYGLPADYRVKYYAAAEIRDYMRTRLLLILDKAAYGLPLTTDEQAALDYLSAQVLEADRRIADYADAEYRRWDALRCSYVPPAAPGFVTAPLGTPVDVADWCAVPRSPLATAGAFAPPTPSADHFQTWGMYRHAADLGLDFLGSPAAMRMMSDAVTAGVMLGGLATAGLAAGGTFAIVGASAALSQTATAIMGGFAASSYAAAKWPASLVAAMSAGTGPAAAAAVVGIVILAIVGTTVAIVQFVEHQQIGDTIRARRQAAHNTVDPFGIAGLRQQWQGQPFREGWTPETMPFYHHAETNARLMQLVLKWTSTREDGGLVPDYDELWPDNATRPNDIHFSETRSGLTNQRAAVTLRGPGGPVEIRFSKRWMIVTEAGSEPRAALRFTYLDHDGDAVVAMRDPHGPGFVVAPLAGAAQAEGEAVETIAAVLDDGTPVTIGLVNPGAGPPEAAPVPAAVGVLHPGRVVNLRANPVDAEGRSITDPEDGYSYQWTIARQDPDGGWTVVSAPSTYGAQVMPTEPGNYRAEVTMTPQGASDGTSGAVEFAVTPPVVTIDDIELVDDGHSSLDLRLRLSERVPDDVFTVSVGWPADAATGVRERTEVTFDCVSQGIECESGPVPRSVATHTLDPARTDTSSRVVVTIANSWGYEVTRELSLDGDRPLFVARPEQAPPGEATHSVITFDAPLISAQVPVLVDDLQNYTLAAIETENPGGLHFYGGTAQRLVDEVPGLVLAIVPGADDDAPPLLTLSGVPPLSHVGLYDIPIAVDDADGTAFAILRLQVVASLDDRFRAGLVRDELSPNSVPPFEPIVLGGQAGNGLYDGEFCVSLQQASLPDPATVVCGELDRFFAQDGSPRPFPYPTLSPQGLEGLYRASTWLPDTGPEVFPEPMTFLFHVPTGPPSVTELAWDPATASVRLEAEAAADVEGVAGAQCTLNGGEPQECFAAEPLWPVPGLADGTHELQVFVTDTTGNFTTRTLVFTVGDDVDEPGGPGTGNEQPGPGGPGATPTPTPRPGTPPSTPGGPPGALSPPSVPGGSGQGGSVQPGTADRPGGSVQPESAGQPAGDGHADEGEFSGDADRPDDAPGTDEGPDARPSGGEEDAAGAPDDADDRQDDVAADRGDRPSTPPWWLALVVGLVLVLGAAVGLVAARRRAA